MHVSYLADAAPTLERVAEGLDGGRARPFRAMIVTLAAAVAGLAIGEAVSPGLLTLALTRAFH